MSTASGHRVLITGGARSGKSEFAEEQLASSDEVLYVATGPAPSAADVEWSDRIRRHRDRRSPTWRTVETNDLPAVLNDHRHSIVLIDCLGNWLTSAMESAECWAIDEFRVDEFRVDEFGADEFRADEFKAARDGAEAALAESLADLMDAWSSATAHVIAVTNEVGSGVVPHTASGRWFRDELGRLNSMIARVSEEVWLVTVGIGQRLK